MVWLQSSEAKKVIRKSCVQNGVISLFQFMTDTVAFADSVEVNVSEGFLRYCRLSRSRFRFRSKQSPKKQELMEKLVSVYFWGAYA